MTKEQIVSIINEYRKNFKPDLEEKKGMRFFDDDRIIRKLRMDFFQEENLIRLPSIEEFFLKVSPIFIHENVEKALREQSYFDYNYENSDKWL